MVATLTPVSSPRLLVVDDDPGVGYAVTRWLQDQNIRSVLAASTDEALQMLRDMVFIYEGANTVVEGELSMQKLSLLSTVLREMRDFQRREMSPKPPDMDSVSQGYFEGLAGVSEDALWSLSRSIEAARNVVPDDSDSSISQNSQGSVPVGGPTSANLTVASNIMTSSSSSISSASSPATSGIVRK